MTDEGGEAEESEVRDEGEGGEADVNAERYLEYCRRMGVRPKFSGNWQKANDPRGNFIHDKGFWKLLIDRRMYDRNKQFQDLTPVDAAGFEPHMVDQKWTGSQFTVTQVADDAGVERIRDAVIKTESERTEGGMPTVDYSLSMEDAVRDYRRARGAEETAEEAEGGIRLMSTEEGSEYDNQGNLLREGYTEPAPAVERRRLTPKERRQRDAYEARRFRNLHTFVDKTLDKLRIKDICDVYDSIDDVPGAQDMPSRRQHARGWYNPETGRITIVLRNHRNQEDVGLTILHEAVGHHGLRELFGERFDTFLDNVYGGAAPEIHSEINRMARERFERANSQLDSEERQRRMYDATELRRHVRAATEEYLAGLAERTDFRADSSPYYTWWDQIKRWFVEMLHDIGLPNFFAMGDITDNELRYVLWRSYKNLSEPGHYRNPWREAEDVSMQYRLKTGEFAEPAEVENGGGAVAEEGEVRFMMGDGAETFKERQRRAVEEKGVVMPGLNSAEVKVVDVPRHTYTGNIAEATRQAIGAAKAKYAPNGKARTLHYDNFGVTFNYSISGNAVEESLNPKQQAKSVNKGVHLAMAEHLDDVIGQSIEVEEHPDYIKNEHDERDTSLINDKALMHRFYGAVVVDGVPYRVMTLMREERNPIVGNGIHAYEVQKIEVLDEETPNTPNGVGSHPQSEIASSYPLTNILKNVEKSYDPGKLLLDESAKEDRKREIQNTQNGSGGGRANFMVSSERDADYMDAVEKGDAEKAGRMVREAARRAMPETKVVEKGEPLVMSHNTDREFNTFDRERIGTGQGQAYLGYGFNFSRGFSSTYGKNEMRVYLDARNPLQSGGHKLTRRKLEKAIRLIDQKQSSTLVGEFCGGAMPYGSREYERNIGRAIDMLREYDDLSIYASISMTSYDATPNDVIEAFKAIGFDSSIERDSEGRIINAVVFDPNQIKSAEPFTYDDNGRLIPLSERFNLEKDDIRFMSSGELDEKYPNWLKDQTEESGKHSTQIAGTLNSYKKFGEWVKKVSGGRQVSVLDASSGLGYGTEWLRENGIDADDVEPYPSSGRKAPTFSSYDDIDKKYDFIISNAVLNVIPDDWRAGLLHDMADKLNVGGKLVINVRGANSIRNQGKEGVTKITLDDPSEVLVLRPNGSVRAYQKGFTKEELKEWCEKELGDGYTVEAANQKNAGGTYDTAVVVTKTADAEGQVRFMSESVDDGRTEEIMERAKKKFGLTDDVREAGYVLPDGGMLDFSGRNELDAGADDSFLRGSRQEDHRRINSIAYDYDADGNEVRTGVETDMRDFIRRGGIRIDAGGNVGIINLAVKPTEKQRAALRRLINLKGGNVDVDFGDGWNSDHYVEYDGAKAQRVLGDIDRYFDEGIKPEGNVRFMTELGDQSEEAREIYALPERYGLKGYADTACIRERDEIEQYQRYFPDDFIKGLYEEFDDPHSFGYHSNGVVVVFTGKIKPDDGEIVWWHEQTHNIYSKLSKEEQEVFGKACLEYLKENNTKLYNHIQSEYPKEKWLNEACAYFVGNAIDEYGAYAFLNFNLAGREDIVNFVTTFRNHIKYGEGTRENRGNQLRQRFQEAEDPSVLHPIRERGSQSQELEGGAGQENQGGSGSRAGQEREQPGDRVRFMTDEGGEAEESEVRDESEGGEADGSELEGGMTAEEEAAEAVAMEPVEPAEMSLKEQVLQGLMAAAERYRQSGTMRTAAVSEISVYVTSLQNAWRKRKGLNKEALEQTIGAKVRRGMSWQKAEDQALVEQTVRLAKLMLQGNFAKGLTPGEVKRLMGYIQTAVGRPTDAGEGRRNAGTQDPVAAAKSIVDLLALNQLRTMKGMVGKMMQVKTSKVNSQGVEVQAGLDLKGQVVVKAMREALQLSEDDLGAMVGELRDAMGSEDPITAENAALRWQGYMLAVEYNNQVRDSESEEKQLFRELRAAEQVRYPNRKRPVRKDGSVGEVVSDEDSHFGTREQAEDDLGRSLRRKELSKIYSVYLNIRNPKSTADESRIPRMPMRRTLLNIW